MGIMGTLSAEQAFYNLRYGIGIVMEVALAYWLLSKGGSPFGPSAVAAYVLLATSAAALLFGFFWYWAWFAQRGGGGRYLLTVSFLVGIGLLSVALFFKPDVPPSICGRDPYPPCAESAYLEPSLFLFGFCLAGVPVVYGAWRLTKYVVVRTFGVLLIAISQIGAAWRGELRS